MPEEMSIAPLPNTPQTVGPADGDGQPTGNWLARNRRFAMLGGIVLVLGGALAAVAWINRSAPTNNNTAVSNTPTGSIGTNRSTVERFPATISADEDGDGLTDEAERLAGTRMDLSDTDGDGLSDREESVVYKTDPLRQDTDGDGQSDGREVAAGQNPAGPGLLRDLTQAIQQLNQSE